MLFHTPFRWSLIIIIFIVIIPNSSHLLTTIILLLYLLISTRQMQLNLIELKVNGLSISNKLPLIVNTFDYPKHPISIIPNLLFPIF